MESGDSRVNISDQIEDPSSDLLTIRDYIRYGMSLFYRSQIFLGHGTDDYWDESLRLVLHGVNLPLDVDRAVLDARLTQVERIEVIDLLQMRVKERIPVPYLTHEAYFAGFRFYVDNRVMIPRSPIGELILQRFSPWAPETDSLTVLELCTGSGCIAIATALTLPEAIVDAVDISKDALAVAKINVEQHELSDRVNLIESDLFSEISETYDIIVSNPPYVGVEEYGQLPEEYFHEPQMAFCSGHDGLDIVKRILREAPQYLTPEGILIVEVGNSAELLAETYPQVPFVWLEFERGEDGVFMLTREQLETYAADFAV